MNKVVLHFILFLGFFCTVISGTGQTYTPTEQLTIAENARRLVQDRYLTNLEVLTHYELNQPFEVLQQHIQSLVKDAFRSRDVLVYNEFRNPAGAYTTIGEYVKDCRIFSGGKPVTNTLGISEARYQISQTPEGLPFINLYVEKQAQGLGKQNKPFRFQNRVEFRIVFVADPKLNAFHSFKIAGISKVDQWPETAFALSTSALEQAERSESSLFSVLSQVTNQLKKTLPPGLSQLVLDRFSYNQCGITDALSDRIFATFSSCLQKQAFVEVRSPAESVDARIWVHGYYKEDLNQVRLVVEVVDATTRQVISKVENTDLPLSWLRQQGLGLKPDQYEEVMAMQDTLRPTLSGSNDPLTIEIRTDRGRSGVEYWAGNQLRIEAKVNRPAHLRLVYRLADGTCTLLENDFEINARQVNRFVPIAPDATLLCAEPFGTEYVLAYASETAFCPISSTPNPKLYLRNEGGYFRLVGTLSEVLAGVRCTINKKNVKEDKIQITTRSSLP